MVFRITKKTTKKQIDEWFASLPPSRIEFAHAKKFDAKKFAGKLKKKNWDGLKMQKEMCNEWR
jgi:hypothetical protein